MSPTRTPARLLTRAPRRAATIGALASLMALTGLGAPTGVTAAGAAPAAPALLGSCSLTASTTLAIDRPRAAVTLGLASDCPLGAWAVWDVVDPGGRSLQRVSLTPGATARLAVPADGPLGTYRMRPVTAYADDFTQLGQPARALAVGLRSTTTAVASRSGSTVTVRAGAAVYDRATDAYAPRRTTVTLQRSACAAGCAWTAVASATTDAKGLATLTATSNGRAYWRTHAAGTPTVFAGAGRTFAR